MAQWGSRIQSTLCTDWPCDHCAGVRLSGAVEFVRNDDPGTGGLLWVSDPPEETSHLCFLEEFGQRCHS